MIKHSVLAKLCEDLYDPVTPGVFDHIWTKDDVIIGLTKVEEQDVLVLRGSVTIEDWMRDGIAIPVWHPKLGFVHAGFMLGMDDVFAEVTATSPVIIGHSLGGARARILAALYATAGVNYAEVVTFGSPKPGFVNLRRILEKSGQPHTSYRFANDVVPTVPLTLPPFLDFVHTEDWIELPGHSAADDLLPLRDHQITNYRGALALVESDGAQECSR